MANFCSECGAKLTDAGNCPVCNPFAEVLSQNKVEDGGVNAAMAAAPVWEERPANEDYTADLQRLLADEEREQKAAEARRQAEEEYARRREEQESARETQALQQTRAEESKSFSMAEMFGEQTGSAGTRRTLMCAAYLFFLPVFWLTNYLFKGDETARFHCKEGAKLLLAYYILKGIGIFVFPSLLKLLALVGAAAGLALGVSNVVNGKCVKLPLLDKLPFLDELAEKILPR